MNLEPLLALCLADRPATSPQQAWTAWSFAPEVVLPLAVAAMLWLRARRRSVPAPAARHLCFLVGIGVLAVALLSPLCRMAATLASAHMVQHALLVLVAPPLLLIGAGAALPTAPSRRRLGAVARHLATPLPATAVYGAAIWLWHIPVLYEASLRNELVHLAAYATLLGAGLLFWHAQLATARGGAAGHLSAAAGALATALHTGVLGALLTFAGRPWYPVFGGRAEGWGLTPLEDQQLAGLIMWVPMGLAYLCAAGVLLLAWLRQVDRGTLVGET